MLEFWKKLDKKKIIPVVGIVIVVAFLAVVIYCNSLVEQVKAVSNQNQELKIQLDELKNENSELQDKVAILSDTVNYKVKEEEEREAEIAKVYIPTGFPIQGTATHNEELKTLDNRKITEFVAEPGTSIIATAEGTVSAIEDDEDYGHCIRVDHGNGYISIYRNASKVKVEVGDTVTTETVLYVIESGNEKLGYQIMENNRYIDPLDLMEIYG